MKETEDSILDELCEDCKQKYKSGESLWMCEICRKIFEPKDEVGLNNKIE